jgi:streptomycin 6-kinase
MTGIVAFRLPTNLSDNARADCGEWLLCVPEIVGELADRWSLRLGDPYEPGGSCSWVAPAQTAARSDLVLKVGWRHDEAESEADGLRTWQGRRGCAARRACVPCHERVVA